MNGTLHDAGYAQRILDLTADTMLLVDRNGTCVDIDTHCNLWFMQEDKLLGKNLFELLPEHTRQKIVPNLQRVINEQKSISKNYKLPLNDRVYYFKCIMYPFDGMVLCQYRDITERSNVKLLLERANRNLREVQNVAKIGYWTYNTGQHECYYKGHMDIMCTDEVQSISIERYKSLIVDDDKEAFDEWLARNRKEPDNKGISYHVRINDDIYYVSIQAYQREVLPDGSINLEGYIQNITDIQNRRNDINTLTHAINNARESICAMRKDGTLIFANRQFQEYYQLTDTEDLSKLKIYDVVGNLNSREDWEGYCKEASKGRCSNFVAYHPVKNNDSILAFEGVIYNVTNDSGEESYWVFTHDISERIRYESEIKRLNQIMNTIIDNLPAGIVVKDIENNYQYIYRNRESYNRDICVCNTVGQNDFDYYPPELAQSKRNEDMEVSASGKEMHWVTEGKDKSGNPIILDKRKIKVSGDGFSPIIISIEWNITELENVKRELQVSKEKAEMSDKFKSAFLANMSHEIRTPLNAIVGFSHIISESDDAQERNSYYEIVEANTERLLQLINEILDLSKIEAGIVEFTLETVKLENLCKEVYDAHIFRTPQGVKLIRLPSEENVIVETDKNRLFQVFSNLIGNAFKFTKEGSVSYGYRKEADRIVFEVTDTGMGIEQKKIGRIFERFVKLNNVAQGTGLGLSICKTIIERLGGEISVVSELDKGTAFTFTLPYKDSLSKRETTGRDELSAENLPQDSGKAAADNRPEAEKNRQMSTILIAEDTDSNYDLLCAILGRRYKLFRARDGMEAVTMFNEIQPDLVLMDIKMPNLDGIEATKIIRELSPTVPIIAQSAYAYEKDRNAAAEAGCNDFLTKPFSQTKLEEAIKKWI